MHSHCRESTYSNAKPSSKLASPKPSLRRAMTVHVSLTNTLRAPVTLRSSSCHSPLTIPSTSCHYPVEPLSRCCHSPVTLLSGSCHSPVTLLSRSGRSPVKLLSPIRWRLGRWQKKLTSLLTYQQTSIQSL